MGNVSRSALDAGDQYGFAVSLDGTRLAVGAPFDDDSVTGSTSDNYGAVFLYTFADTSFNTPTLQAIIGEDYTGGKNIDMAPLLTSLNGGEEFGSSVSLDGTRLAVGAPNDDGQGDSGNHEGAVYLFTFTDSVFSNNGSATDGTGALQGLIGEGYNTRSKDVNISSLLDNDDNFGSSVSLDGTLLAVGALNDDASGNTTSDSGAAYLFSFSDSVFTGGSRVATIGDGYTGGENINENLDISDNFGRSISLDGTRVVIGASGDDGSGNVGSEEGAVYLYTFTGSFTSITKQATIGESYTGGNNVDLSSLLDNTDRFGRAVSLDGNDLAVGSSQDDGQGGSCSGCGAVYLFHFTDSSFSNGGSATDGTGALQAIMGNGYNTRTKDVNLDLDADDNFGRAVSLDSNRIAIGVPRDDGLNQDNSGSTDNEGAVYLFNIVDADDYTDAVFATRADEDLTISATTLAGILSTPTSVVLQANNDITIDSAITAANGGGAGGDLTLQGRKKHPHQREYHHRRR